MNREEIKKAVANVVVDFARSEAEAAIKSIDLDDVQKLVDAQMKNLTDPLEAEIQTTTSWWVKIRNRLYITLLQQAVKAIVADDIATTGASLEEAARLLKEGGAEKVVGLVLASNAPMASVSNLD